jgi:threonine/homoserine/homoserine lactone efflux protein
MNWQDFTAFLMLATAMSFSPGPNTTLSTALAANHGLRRAMPFVCAVPVGWGALLALCALGLGALVVAVPLLSWAVKLLGVGYLLWLAYRLAVKTPPLITGAPAAVGPVVTFWQGAALQFVNIKAWMLALSIVSGWIAGQPNAPLRFAIVLPVMLVFAFASNLVYALVGSLLRTWLAGPHGTGARLVGFNRVMAAVLVVTASWMAVV